MPGWVAIPLSVILLDLLIYWQHRVTHAVPLLWRLHRVHHVDPELDATSGLRFHPVEILLSMALKMAVVVALGAPAVAVLVFEVLLNATAMFNHAAISLPPGLERALRLVLVIPDPADRLSVPGRRRPGARAAFVLISRISYDTASG